MGPLNDLIRRLRGHIVLPGTIGQSPYVVICESDYRQILEQLESKLNSKKVPRETRRDKPATV